MLSFSIMAVTYTGTPLCHRPRGTPVPMEKSPVPSRGKPLKFRPHWQKWSINIPTMMI